MVYDIQSLDDFKRAIDKICADLISKSVCEEKIFDCKLAAHELISNVLQHSGGGTVLEVVVTEEAIQITVCAEKPFIPPMRGECPPTEAERGRGLYLIDSVCAERAFTKEGAIKVRIALK